MNLEFREADHKAFKRRGQAKTTAHRDRLAAEKDVHKQRVAEILIAEKAQEEDHNRRISESMNLVKPEEEASRKRREAKDKDWQACQTADEQY